MACKFCQMIDSLLMGGNSMAICLPNISLFTPLKNEESAAYQIRINTMRHLSYLEVRPARYSKCRMACLKTPPQHNNLQPENDDQTLDDMGCAISRQIRTERKRFWNTADWLNTIFVAVKPVRGHSDLFSVNNQYQSVAAERAHVRPFSTCWCCC